MTEIAETPSIEGALEALCVRVATASRSGRMLWRSGGFAAALPGVDDLTDPVGVEGLAEAFADCAVSGRPVAALVTAKGRKGVYDARLAPSADGASIHIELQDAASRRVEERRRLEDRERLLLTSRVLSVGEMASMIAHELNQPIGSVVNLLRGLKAKLARGALDAEEGQRALDRGIDQALYASGVIQRVRTFVDQRQPQVAPLDLAKLARDTIGLLDWEIQRDHVDTESAVPESLPPVLGDPVMIQQVLVNIARNAIEAMRGETGRAAPSRLGAVRSQGGGDPHPRLRPGRRRSHGRPHVPTLLLHQGRGHGCRTGRMSLGRRTARRPPVALFAGRWRLDLPHGAAPSGGAAA